MPIYGELSKYSQDVHYVHISHVLRPMDILKVWSRTRIYIWDIYVVKFLTTGYKSCFPSLNLPCQGHPWYIQCRSNILTYLLFDRVQEPIPGLSYPPPGINTDTDHFATSARRWRAWCQARSGRHASCHCTAADFLKRIEGKERRSYTELDWVLSS